jgi:hypothetical protein
MTTGALTYVNRERNLALRFFGRSGRQPSGGS